MRGLDQNLHCRSLLEQESLPSGRLRLTAWCTQAIVLSLVGIPPKAGEKEGRLSSRTAKDSHFAKDFTRLASAFPSTQSDKQCTR